MYDWKPVVLHVQFKLIHLLDLKSLKWLLMFFMWLFFRSALSAVRPGGTVVYSTCTLSSLENYSVVETVLKDCPEAEPEDLWEELAVPFSKYFAFSHGQTAHLYCGTMSLHNSRLGILVVPYPGKTWGPMFLSRIRRRMWFIRICVYKPETFSHSEPVPDKTQSPVSSKFTGNIYL